MSNTNTPATAPKYRRMGLLALTICIALFLIPNITLAAMLGFAQQYETIQHSGILEVSAATNGQTESQMPFQNIYEARYAIIGITYIACWSLLAAIAFFSTRPTRSKDK